MKGGNLDNNIMPKQVLSIWHPAALSGARRAVASKLILNFNDIITISRQ